LKDMNVHPKLIQHHMRHSDITLTMGRYTHLRLSHEAEAGERCAHHCLAAGAAGRGHRDRRGCRPNLVTQPVTGGLTWADFGRQPWTIRQEEANRS
jgi:hypothetical protein